MACVFCTQPFGCYDDSGESNILMRFDPNTYTSTLRYLSCAHNTPLDIYDMVKLHILTDFFHILAEGEPGIGGTPKALPYGPVVQGAYGMASEWGGSGGDFYAVQQAGNRVLMAPKQQDTGDLWPELIDAASQAWNLHSGMSFKQSQSFFHDSDQYFGRVWSKYKPDDGKNGWGSPIEWDEVIRAYEDISGNDCSDVLTLLSAPTHGELADLAQTSPPPQEYWNE